MNRCLLVKHLNLTPFLSDGVKEVRVYVVEDQLTVPISVRRSGAGIA